MILMQSGHVIIGGASVLACKVDSSFAFPPGIDVMIKDGVYYIRTVDPIWVNAIIGNWIVAQPTPTAQLTSGAFFFTLYRELRWS